MESIIDQTSTLVARWKQWASLNNQSRRPDPFQDEYQLLSMPGESASETKEPEETSISSPPYRPPIALDSPSLFVKSLYARFLSIWTPSFTYAILGGQLLSAAVTCLSVSTSELVKRNWILPCTQSFLGYAPIFLMFTPYTIHKYGFKGWIQFLMRDGWKYFLLALADSEGSFLAIKALNYTDLLSAMLLDAWVIPVCLFTSWIYMRTKYHWTQILGVAICICGLCLLVISDFVTGRDEHAERREIGDAMVLVSATIFGVVNATEEFFVRQSPVYEVVGQLGMWATLVMGIQAFVLERDLIPLATWDSGTFAFLLAFVLCQTLFFSIALFLFRTASSSYLNMSLLTSDFYGLIVGLYFFHYSPYWLYFPAFVVVMSGLVIYFWHATPEEQGKSDVRMPSYIYHEM